MVGMNKNAFEGTLVLERLAEMEKLEEFYEAVDADDFLTVTYLMKSANIDADTIKEVVQRMADGED